MHACTTGTEAINHSLERRKRRGAVGPDVSAVNFLFAWHELLNRSLIGVDHAQGQHLFTQRIDQRLELHTYWRRVSMPCVAMLRWAWTACRGENMRKVFSSV